MPTPGKFHTAGVNQLYLAWKITISAQQALGIAAASDDEGIEAYWHSVQPELANAYSLIQQAMEMALKGRSVLLEPESWRPIGHWERKDGGLIWHAGVLAFNYATHGPV